MKAQAEGYVVEWDDEVKGFGLRITSTGATSFVLRYRVDRRQRVYTIGSSPEWTAVAARNEALELRKKIREGSDPMGERIAVRSEPTFGDLVDGYLASEELTRLRPHTRRDYIRMCEKILRPGLGRMPLKSIQRRDVEALHGAMKRRPIRPTAHSSLLSRSLNFAGEQKLLQENPAKGIKPFHEERRNRHLNGGEYQTEIQRFTAALDDYKDQTAANALRLLLLTGSRSGEVLKSTWEQFDLHRGVWVEPSSSTKQKKTEHLPLGEAALELLRSMRPAGAARGFLFVGRDGKRARAGLRRPWLQACKAAGLVTVAEVQGKRGLLKRYKPTVRVHDLRHTFASHLVSNGASLQVVGAMLGHRNAATTMRYSHIADTAKRERANQWGQLLEFASAKKLA